MIQIQVCPVCQADIDALEFNEHKSQCCQKSSPQSKRSDGKKSKELTIDLNAELIKPYTHITKFSQVLNHEIKQIISQYFQNEIQLFNLFLSTEKISIQVQAADDFQLSRARILKDLIEDELNSYEVISFKIQPNYLECVYHLEDQYVLEQTHSGVLMIAKKDVMLPKVVRFFEDLLSLNKISKKVTLESQVLQFDEDKEKQISDLLKSITMFIANADQVSIKTKNIQKKCLVIICGQKQAVLTCKEYMLESLSSEKFQIPHKKYRVTEQEQKILIKQKILQKFKQQFGIKYEFKSFTISRSIKLNKYCTVQLLSSPSIFAIPKSAYVIVKQQFLKEIKQIQQSVQFLKEYLFYSIDEEAGSIEEGLKQFINFYVQDEGEIAVILPQNKKEQFVDSVIFLLNSISKKIKLYMLERSDERQAIDALSKCVQKQKKWYVVKKGKKIYYPEKVNMEIESALMNGIGQLFVTQKELGITKITHKFSDEIGEIIHIKTGISNFVEMSDGKLLTFLDEDTFFVHQNKLKPNQLTLAVFELNLATKQQRSLITNEKLHMNYQVVKTQNSQAKIQYEKELTQVIIKYPDLDSIDEIWSSIKNIMNKNRVIKEFSVEGISGDKIIEISNWCKLNKIEISIEGEKLIATSYHEACVHNLQKLLEIHHKKILAAPKEYPPYWVIDEKQDLKIFNINKDTEQFKMVQNQFKVGIIKKLERIQNKILFEKYSTEKEFLSEQNGTNVRELMMYHGTRANPPEMIYNDRQESFNINYANMGSYGKGIYFAKNSEYSNNYCYNAGGMKQMFYCLVLAGNSQIWNGKQTHNTSYRDAAKRIRYQSVCDSKAQTILVVFKNRRAYPLYLISY